MLPYGSVREIALISANIHKCKLQITAPAHTEGLTMTQTGMTFIPTQLNRYQRQCSRDDRTLAPTMQPNASREFRTLAQEKPEHQQGSMITH